MSEEGRFRRRRILFFSGALIIVLAVVLVAILSGKRSSYLRDEVKSRTAAAKAGLGVRVVSAKPSSGIRSISLVGEARPYAAVTLYAKVSGYLKEINVDKGDRVDGGKILAVIESPEVDRQFDAALADAKNKRTDAERFRILVKKGFVSRQDADNAETAAMVAEATAEALRIQKGYEILRAPFRGTVTARFADPGALVQSAINAQTTALPVVALSQTDRLRVYVYLDQRDAVTVRPGDRAEISDPVRPEVKLPASVTRVSGELDQKTRTLLTELDLDNERGLILSGSFVQVILTLKTPRFPEIPADALLMKGDQAFVGVISAENRVNFRPVTIADSNGKVVKVRSGLAEGERVVLNPGFGIAEGELVQPVDVTSR